MKVNDLKKIDRKSLLHCGFQATNVGRAIEIIETMKKENATVFLTFTSNLIASGLRGLITEMCKEKFIDVIITAGGSLDHDLIKSSKDYEIGKFVMDDAELHQKGMNRIGNILVSNECYEYLEGFMMEVFQELYSNEKIISRGILTGITCYGGPSRSQLHPGINDQPHRDYTKDCRDNQFDGL